MKKLRKKYKEVCADLEDIEREHEREKEDLLDSIRNQDKDAKFYAAVLDILLTKAEIGKIKERSKYDEDKNEYIIPPFILRGKKVKFPKLGGRQSMEMVNQEKENRELEFEEHNRGSDINVEDDDEDDGGDPFWKNGGSSKQPYRGGLDSTKSQPNSNFRRSEGLGIPGKGDVNYMNVNATYASGNYRVQNTIGYEDMDRIKASKPNPKNVVLDPIQGGAYSEKTASSAHLGGSPSNLPPLKNTNAKLKPLNNGKNIEVSFKATLRFDENGPEIEDDYIDVPVVKKGGRLPKP